jgi:hypothetical protein
MEKKMEDGIGEEGDGEETLAASSMASQRLMAHCRQMTDSYIRAISTMERDDDEDGQRARRTGKSTTLATFLPSSLLCIVFFFPFLFFLFFPSSFLFPYTVVILFTGFSSK